MQLKDTEILCVCVRIENGKHLFIIVFSFIYFIFKLS